LSSKKAKAKKEREVSVVSFATRRFCAAAKSSTAAGLACGFFEILTESRMPSWRETLAQALLDAAEC
jgi:hypothetical protein